MLKFFLSLLLLIANFISGQIIDIKNVNNNKWYIVNDDVMGGISKGNISYINNTLIFKGEISYFLYKSNVLLSLTSVKK